jgi:hypothetical protein
MISALILQGLLLHATALQVTGKVEPDPAQELSRIEFLGDSFEVVGRYPFQNLVRGKAKSRYHATISKGVGELPRLLKDLGNQAEESFSFQSNYIVTSLDQLRLDPRARLNASLQEPIPEAFIDNLPFGAAHRVTKGDLAFFALGQITNRWYLPLTRYQGAFYQVSPPLVAGLPERLRREWKGLTPAQHFQLLEKDLLEPDSFARESLALRKLIAYFPKKAEGVALVRLSHVLSHGYSWKGSPLAVEADFFLCLSLIPSQRIDNLCVRLTRQQDAKARKTRDYALEVRVLNYLRKRPAHLNLCRRISAKRIASGEDASGYYARLLGLLK